MTDMQLAAIADYYKSKAAYLFKIKELTSLQREHLAWRIDHKTGYGMGFAGSVARMENDWGEKIVGDVFKHCLAEPTQHAIAAHAYAVLKFDNFGTMVLK